MLDLISLAAKNPLVKAFFCVCLCVCMCARACCSGCFLLAFLTGSWCGVQLRTGKRPFLSTVNHLREREKKMKKEWRGKKRDQAAALIQPSAIWPASLSVPLSFHSLYLSVYLSFFVCVWSFSDSRWTAVFWRDSGVYGEFTSPVRRLGEGVALWVGVHILPVQL